MDISRNTENNTVAREERKKDDENVVSVGRLTWLRFKRNRLAVLGGVFLILMYLSAIFAGFIAPHDPRMVYSQYVSMRPQGLHFFDTEGNFHLVPFAYAVESAVDPATFRKTFEIVPEEKYPLQLFVHGPEYTILGIFESDIHLFGVEEPGRLFLFGTDSQGRDIFSRVWYGAQVSLSVGLVGVGLTLVFGSILGIASGYIGGVFDDVMQRIIELLMSFPQLPLWLALATLIPNNWPSDRTYFAITIVLAVLSWGSLARQTRSMVYALREADFVTAARYSNCSNWRIITRHLLPNTMGHIIVVATTSIPGMILGETSLSFLGLGIRSPLVSWGLLLSDAQHVRVLLQQPWILTPAIFVIATVIAFNFLGDGLRDAADPFAK
ncbi:ABC transporter permease [Phototrophicus methaneseepsis]|uniref:ABC transporter permease n=1 Tax=Phototrophicus methaneseepsis TaxID=2710758 RepID=A0A7S8EAF6_9CHLR|nr:ABC transporter permease [Phototrophicus methaneseepsis]QPC83365.1 ABC transporter permease [Phototrophicus methaneseepsis]